MNYLPTKSKKIAWLVFAMTVVMISSLDIYVPVAPDLARIFGVSDHMIKLTFLLGPLGSCLIGIPFGYLSDRKGRAPVVVISLILFQVGTLLLALSPNMTVFFVGRALQSLGAGGLSIMGGAILADLFHGVTLAKYMGIYSAIFPLAFALAPIVGAQLYVHFGWRSIFLFLFAAMGVIGPLFYRHLPESKTQPKEKKGVFSLFKSKGMRLLILANTLPGTVGAIFTVNSPFLYINVFHFDPSSFSMIQAIPIGIQCLGAVIYQRLVVTIGMRGSFNVGLITSGLFSLLSLLTLFKWIPQGPYNTIAILSLFSFGATFIMSTAGAIILDSSGEHKGLNVSLLNFIRNLLLAVIVTLASLVPNETVYPMLGAMLSIALIVMFLIYRNSQNLSPASRGLFLS